MVTAQIATPPWFFGVDATFEFIAAIIAILVAVSALRIFRLTQQSKYRVFGISFILMGLGFLIRGFSDVILEKLIRFTPAMAQALPHAPGGISRTAFVFLSGYIGHIMFLLAAYVFLVIVTYRIEDKALMLLLFGLAIPPMLISSSYFLSFYGISFILMGAVTYRHHRNCMQRAKTTKISNLVTIAFGFITLAQPNFVLSAYNRIPDCACDVLYASGHIIQILGFVLILIALVKTRRK